MHSLQLLFSPRSIGLRRFAHAGVKKEYATKSKKHLMVESVF